MSQGSLSMVVLRQQKCTGCIAAHKIRCNGGCTCPEDPDAQEIHRHIEVGYCPKGLFSDGGGVDRPAGWESGPPRPPRTAPPVNDATSPDRISPDRTALYHALWSELHRFVLTAPLLAGVKVFLENWSLRIPCGECKLAWRKILAAMPADFSSRRASFIWTVRVHNAVNRHLHKPEISVRRAAAIHGVAGELGIEPEPEEERPVKTLLQCDWSLGDSVVISSAVRDMQARGGYEIYVRSKHPAVFENLIPAERNLLLDAPMPDGIELHYRLDIEFSPNLHFIQHVNQTLSRFLGHPLPLEALKPHLILSEAEIAAPLPGGLSPGTYWVMLAGGKKDCTAKIWPAASWQRVVNALRDRVLFAQTGDNDPSRDIQTPLQGAVNLLGKTSIRDYFRLIYHAAGVVSGVTSAVHIAAAFDKPCVVVAGGREAPWIAHYPKHQYLTTYATMPCTLLRNANKGCWALRAHKLGEDSPPEWKSHDGSLCDHPEGDYASCMTAIKPAEVVRAIERYL
jgi:ADP-heptose:LPS heptosyltransferase